MFSKDGGELLYLYFKINREVNFSQEATNLPRVCGLLWSPRIVEKKKRLIMAVSTDMKRSHKFTSSKTGAHSVAHVH